MDKEDYYNIGKEIIKNVGKGPKMCRMGDIYHMIKQRVDKLSQFSSIKPKDIKTISPVASKVTNMKTRIKMLKKSKGLNGSDSEDSF